MLPENMGPHLPLNVMTSVQRFDGRDLGTSSPYRRAGQLQAGEFRSKPSFAAPTATPLPGGSDRFLGQRSDRRFRTCPLRRTASPSIGGSPGISPMPKEGEKQAEWERSPTPPPSGIARLARSTWRSTATVSTRSPRR